MTKTYVQALREFQLILLVDALVEAKGSVREAALALEIHRNTFMEMLEKASLLSTGRVRELLKEAGVIPPRKLPKAETLKSGTAKVGVA